MLPGWLRVRELRAAGGEAWWDGTQLCGYPLAANMPIPLFLPEVWAAGWLPAVDALDLLLWFHVALAAFLAYRAARWLGARPPAAALAAAGFSLSAWMTTRWHLPHILYATAWAPCLLVAFAALRAGRRRRAVIEGALGLGLSLLAFPQVGALLALGFAVLVIMDPATRRCSALPAAGLVLLLGALLAAPQLRLSGAAYAASLRGTPETRAATALQGLPPSALCDALLPDFFGVPADFARPDAPAPTMKDWLPQRLLFSADLQDNVVEDALYPGAAGAAAAGRGAGARRVGRRAPAGAAGGGRRPGRAALAAAGARRAAGRAAGGRQRQAPHRAGGLRAALRGGARAAGRAGRARAPRRGAAAARCSWSSSRRRCSALQRERSAGRRLRRTRSGRRSLRQGGLVLLGVLAVRGAARGGWRAWLPAAVLAADLAQLGLAFNPFPLQQPPFPDTPALAALAARGGRIAVLGTANLLPPTAAAVHGLDSVHGVAALVPRRTAELLACIEGPLFDVRDPRVGRPFIKPQSLTHPLLDLLAVDTVVHADPGLAAATGWPVLFEHPDEGLGALARPTAGPRAFLCGGARLVPDAAARLATLADRGWQPHASVLLERDPGLPLPATGAMLPVDVHSEHPGERAAGAAGALPRHPRCWPSRGPRAGACAWTASRPRRWWPTTRCWAWRCRPGQHRWSGPTTRRACARACCSWASGWRASRWWRGWVGGGRRTAGG